MLSWLSSNFIIFCGILPSYVHLKSGNEEPEAKKRFTDDNSHEMMDPKVVADQVTNNLVQRAAMGPMQVEEVTIPNKIVGVVIGKGMV